MLSDQTILAVIGSILTLMIGIIGFFIKHWMTATDRRDARANELIETINSALLDLNSTLNSVNTGLQIYQAGTNETIINLKETVRTHTNELEANSKTVQNHEVRISIIEKTKLNNNENSNRR